MKLQPRPYGPLTQAQLLMLKKRNPELLTADGVREYPAHMILWATAKLHDIVWNAINRPMRED